MNPEATSPLPPPDPRTPASPQRRRHRPRIELRRLGRAALGSARHRMPDAMAHVAEAHRSHHPGADLELLRRAYVLAESSHRGQMRKSGEPYITHPLAVTLILAELGAETTTLTASLLHDTVEDTEVTLDQVGEEFGHEVRYLVDGVTKLEKVDYGTAAEPETFRKMLVAAGNDVRVMSIKLADRLHNMRTLKVMRQEKQERIALVTRDVLIPLAERLGVQALKTELEDLVFAILHPAEHAEAHALLAAHTGRPQDPLEEFAGQVRGVLREAGLTAEVLVRSRHLVSVHRVRRKRGRLRGADFARLLILVEEDADCYGVLGELHTCFRPVVAEFKDFIAVPKFNLYQSLHTAVALDPSGAEADPEHEAAPGPSGTLDVVEILIRTHRMHRVAEAGVVALGNPYAPADETRTGAPEPTGPTDPFERADPTRPGWLSRLLDWQRAAPDPDTFWSTLRADLAQDREIVVLRPDGSPLGLPEGATCVDAAYALYGEDAHACMGARVDGRLAALGTVLHDGDRVQLLMGQDAGSGPSPEWLDHARTPGARIAITRWIAAHPGAGETEREAEEEFATGGRPPAAAADASLPVLPALVSEPPVPGVRLAGCCTPVPQDAVAAFSVRGGRVAVHRAECPGAARMRASGRQEVQVRWGDVAQCRVTLRVESFGRERLLADVTEVIAQGGAAIVSATVEPPAEQRVRHTYTLRLADASRLPRLMRSMREIPGVYDVIRAQATTES